jgi:putative tricarboxylic transport membrane protein
MSDHVAGDDRPLVSHRAVGLAVATLLFASGVVLAFDNYRLGIGWGKDGPDAGYFPFALAVIMCVFSLIGIADNLRRRADKAFVTRAEARRVLTVFVPIVLFGGVMQVLGIYVASAALIGGFMRFVGKVGTWTSLAVGLGVTIAMFWIFEIQFQVPLPKGPLEDWLGF